MRKVEDKEINCTLKDPSRTTFNLCVSIFYAEFGTAWWTGASCTMPCTHALCIAISVFHSGLTKLKYCTNIRMLTLQIPSMQTSLIMGLLLQRVPSLTRPLGLAMLPRRHDSMQGSRRKTNVINLYHKLYSFPSLICNTSNSFYRQLNYFFRRNRFIFKTKTIRMLSAVVICRYLALR